MKTLDDYFVDWENTVFGFGYGTGEGFIIPKLKAFFVLLKEERLYDHTDLELSLGGAETWFLINILCRADILEYGTSPRFGWLTSKGERLRDFIKTKTCDELIDLVCSRTQDNTVCYPDACNCGGYVEGKICQ